MSYFWLCFIFLLNAYVLVIITCHDIETLEKNVQVINSSTLHNMHELSTKTYEPHPTSSSGSCSCSEPHYLYLDLRYPEGNSLRIYPTNGDYPRHFCPNMRCEWTIHINYNSYF